MKARVMLVLGCLMILFAWMIPAQAAAAGTLDPTFSGDGVARSTLLSNSHPTQVQVDTQNRVIVGGFDANTSQPLILRYKATGAPDTAWGHRFLPDFGDVVGLGLAGSATIVGMTQGVVARLNSSGALDKTYGQGGYVRTNGSIGLPTEITAIGTGASGYTYAVGDTALFKIAPDGKSYTQTALCLGGKDYASECGTPDAITVSPTFVYVAGGSPVGLISDGTNSAVVGRFGASGSLDKSYRVNGYAWFDPLAGTNQDYSNATAVAVSPKTGQVWAVGQSCYDYCPHDGPNFYARFSATGSLDFSGEADFGDCGGSCIASSAYPLGVAVQGSKAVVVGDDGGDLCTSTTGPCIGMERVTASGVPDPTFGGTGMILIGKSAAGANDVRIFNQKIVVAGGQYVARFNG